MSKIQADVVKQFGDKLGLGLGSIIEACAIYVRALDEDPTIAATFKIEFPDIPQGAWASFEAVGRQWMDARLLWGGGPFASRIKRLPFSMQKGVLDHGVELLATDGTALRIKSDNITKEQAEQIFAGDHVRDLPEQRAWLEAAKRRAGVEDSPGYEPPAYEIKRGVLNVFRPTRLSRLDVAQIMVQMEA